MTDFTLKDIALSGLIAALYTVLGLAFLPISFGIYQVRVAEALTVLPFVTKAGIPGLFIGCLLANVFGGLGWQDIFFGSIITLLAAGLTRAIHHLSRNTLSLALAFVPVVLLWVGGVLVLSINGYHVWSSAGTLIAMIMVVLAGLAYPRHRTTAASLSLISLAAVGFAIFVAMTTADLKTLLIGSIALLAAWFLSLWVIRIWRRGGNPNEVIAPLPPVVLNALGVSLYLAPLIEVDYWFAVQMIGVGQLIACYLLGLPLLRFFTERKSLFA